MEIKKSYVAFVLVFGLILTALTSCRKEAPTLAKIYIQDVEGNAFSDAVVRIYGEPTVSPHNSVVLDETDYSDDNGSVIFDFTDKFKLGQAGFAVLNIDVSSEDGLLVGSGIIKIEAEKLNHETVIIQPL